MNNPKLRSKALWVAVASLILLIIKDWIGLSIDVALYDRTVDMILTVLILLGVISDNSKGEWFKDEEV